MNAETAAVFFEAILELRRRGSFSYLIEEARVLARDNSPLFWAQRC